jgi:hypothetical protein
LGKSAVLRAINAALTNQQGTDFIKWGETYCEVRIKAGGLEILWHKEEGNNFYRINDQTYTKIGRDEPPKEILSAGFKQVKAGDQKINLNYATQFNPLFLVDKIDSKGADLLTSVYGLDRLYKAIELCNKEQRDNSDVLRMREKDLSLVEKDLERFKDFDSAKEASKHLRASKEAMEASEETLGTLREKYSKIQECAAVCKKLQGIKNVSLPKADDIVARVDEYRKLQQYQDTIEKLSAILKRIKPALSVKIPKELASKIEEAKVEFDRLLIWQRKVDQAQKEADRFSKIEGIEIPTTDIDVEELTRLKGYCTDLERQKRDFLAVKTSLEGVSSEIAKLEEEKSQYKVCPLCGNEMK